MKILLTGSSGLLGRALISDLRRTGDAVCRLVRFEPQVGTDDVLWNPATGEGDETKMEGVDAVVNLAGASIADGRWSAARKQLLRLSRVDSTRNLVRKLRALKQPPKVLVSASAIGFYGNRGDELLTETSHAGGDFLSALARDWESAALEAETAGIRVVLPRFGLILAKDGGALPKMLTPFRLALGGKLGSGKQWMSWIVLEDVIRIVRSAIQNAACRGPMNVVSPNPVRNEDFTRILARVLHRPAFFPVPAFVLRGSFGEMADALLLASQRVIPEKLSALNYQFRQTQLDLALRAILRIDLN